MSVNIVISAAMMYQMAMAEIPQEPHTFTAADGKVWTVTVEVPTYLNWLEYGGYMLACNDDCSVDTIDFGNERVIAAFVL